MNIVTKNPRQKGAFRVKKLNNRILAKRKQKIERRLRKRKQKQRMRPMLTASNIHYELDGRYKGIACGGIGAIHLMAKRLRLVKEIDNNLHLLKRHQPYHESDHVLTLAYNVLAGGKRLQDIKLQRHDEAWLDALGAETIPDPTTAGDFLRRFDENDIMALQESVNTIRKKVWKRQPEKFCDQAIVHIDGLVAETTGECKQGMNLSYNGIWGYHPLVISLAQTREPLYLINRPGNAPSHLDAAQWIDRSLDLVSDTFNKIWIRGDTDFSLTKYFDTWDERCTFVFGMDAHKKLVAWARQFHEDKWATLERRQKYTVKTNKRKRPENVKQRIVKERQFKNIRTVSEQVAEFAYRPYKCKKTYRMIVLRKNLTVEKGELALFDDIRYFFYITNDHTMTPQEIVYFANDRCDHENDIEQLKNGVNAMRMPVNDLVSNWAYMVIAALAWSLKAWYGLLSPNRVFGSHVIRMEFRRFVNTIMMVPSLIIKKSRCIVYRLEGYTSSLREFLKTFVFIKSFRFS